MNQLKHAKGLILVFLSTIMFGSYGMWSRLIGPTQGIFYPGWTRSLIIVVILLPIILYTKQIVSIKREDWKWMAVFLVITSFTQAPLFYAFNHMDIGTATLLFFVAMLLTMYFVGFFFLGEKITKVKIASFLIACIGLYVTFQFSIIVFSLIAALMAIINGVASGGEISFSKKLSENYSSLYLIWLSWVAIMITNGIISVVIGEVQYIPEFNIYWLYQLIYAVAGILGFWLVVEGMRHVEASTGGLVGLLEIVFSLLFGAIVFHEGLSPKVAIGAALIVVAAALPHVVDLVKSKKEY